MISRQFILAETCYGELVTKFQTKYVAPPYLFSLDRQRKYVAQFFDLHSLCIILCFCSSSIHHSPRFIPLTNYATLCISWLYRHQHLLRSHVSFNKCHRLLITSRTANCHVRRMPSPDNSATNCHVRRMPWPPRTSRIHLVRRMAPFVNRVTYCHV